MLPQPNISVNTSLIKPDGLKVVALISTHNLSIIITIIIIIIIHWALCGKCGFERSRTMVATQGGNSFGK